MIDIVIAKYKEDISWTKGLDVRFNPIIYNKDEDSQDYIKLPNLGRESQTYTYHIITNYDNLADFTIFTQANFYPHHDKFLEEINNIDYNSIPGFYPLCNNVFMSDRNGAPYHNDLKVGDYDERLLGRKINELLFNPGALFILTKEAIHEKGWQYFKDLDQYHYEDSQFPWIIERYWATIFNYDFKKHKQT